jgi:hypothetical protein
MEYTKEQLKDIIANIDADYYIATDKPETVDSFLRDMGYFVPMKDIKSVVTELRTKDAYFIKLAKNLVKA